jgi:hypothetical protein
MVCADHLNCLEAEQQTHTHLSLIEADMAMKACSTFKAFFALVSMKGMPISSANSCIHHQL